MIDLPPLPAPDNVWMTQGLGAMHAYHEKQMRSYGEACARAALEAAAKVCDDWGVGKQPTDALRRCIEEDCAKAIRALQVKP